MSDSKEIRCMRRMALRRAEGEIQAAIETFWADSMGFEELQEILSKLKELSGEV